MNQYKINKMLIDDNKMVDTWHMFDYGECQIKTCAWSWHTFRPGNVNFFKISYNAQYIFREYK